MTPSGVDSGYTSDPRTIIVCGDLLRDIYLIQSGVPPSAHHEEPTNTIAANTPGGAWYLSHLIGKICEDVPPGSDWKLTAPLGADDVNHEEKLVCTAYQVCARFPRDGGTSDNDTWRIKHFLGCERPKGEARPEPIPRDRRDPYLLVIDDLGLGFGAEQNRWPLALQKGGNPAHIVVKTSSLPLGPLWQLLLGRFAMRLTVVLSVRALRMKCAAISQALSWDAAVEEITDEFVHGACTQDLSRCG
ncbi:MAG TPA: hypothetical protein VMH22_07795, partial [bacterium]|nr:hypothetical protein [bacterium]